MNRGRNDCAGKGVRAYLSENDDGTGGEDHSRHSSPSDRVEEDGQTLVYDNVGEEESNEDPMPSTAKELVHFGCMTLGPRLAGRLENFEVDEVEAAHRTEIDQPSTQ